jgi:MFS family permease
MMHTSPLFSQRQPLAMTQTLFRIATLLVAVAVLLCGHGLQLTLLPMRAETLGWTAGAIGITGSAYFLGFIVGCLSVPALVSRVGHIRTFMVMGASAALALLGVGLFDALPAWLVLRFATGYALSGLYMVIESWLSEAAPPDSRSMVLAIYTLISLTAMALGQGFLAFGTPADLRLVIVGAMLLCLATIPIGLSRMTAPHPLPAVRFSPGLLLRASRVAVVTAFLGGLVTGAIWSVGPLVGRSFGMEGGAVGALMGVLILGGALSQLPVGRLSDRTDRRFVIAGLLSAGALLGLLGFFLSPASGAGLFAVMFLIGAVSMPIYALCIATASDNASVSMIEVASGILIMNSLGSILGPLMVAALIGVMGGQGFFLYVAVVFSIAATWALYRISTVERERVHDQMFIGLPKTTPVAVELSLPEASGDDDEGGGGGGGGQNGQDAGPA